MEREYTEPVINLLPNDGAADYYGKVLTPDGARHYLDRMLRYIDWRNDEAVIFGRHIVTKRKVAWYGDRTYSYAYSGKVRDALRWTPELLELKSMVERLVGRDIQLLSPQPISQWRRRDGLAQR